LAKAGHKAKKISASCTVEFGPRQGGGFEVKSSLIEVEGDVPGMDAAGFEKAAQAAKEGCPVSGALKIPITLKATLG
ncbi:MAG TPA: peroxiredoxin, partial [Myxococcales bacterium]|nr:peroxiredoxin [Myxococcales bacterium]